MAILGVLVLAGLAATFTAGEVGVKGTRPK
jgi:hypothetical protein